MKTIGPSVVDLEVKIDLRISVANKHETRIGMSESPMQCKLRYAAKSSGARGSIPLVGQRNLEQPIELILSGLMGPSEPYCQRCR